MSPGDSLYRSPLVASFLPPCNPTGDIPPDSDDDEGDEIDDAEGEDNGGASMAQEDLMDDSIHAFEGHTEPVYAVAWSPTGSDVVASGGGDDRAFVWQVGEDAYMETQGATFELTGHTDSVIALAFSSDGTLLASGGMDGCVKVWDPATGTCIQTLEGPGEAIEWVRWHPRGNVVLAGSADFTVWMWLAQTGACMQVFTGHSGPVTCGAFSADGKLVVTGGGEDDATLRVWDPRTGECKVTVHGNHFHGAGLTCLAVHPESAVVVTGAEEGSAKLVALETGRIVGSLVGHEEEGSVEAVAFVPGLNVVATCGMDGKLIVWDVATATARTTCEHPGVSLYDVKPFSISYACPLHP